MAKNGKSGYYIGIDLGGTNMQVGVVSSDLKLLSQAKKKTKAEDGVEGVMSRIVEGVVEACSEAKVKLTDLEAIGLAAPGAVDPAEGIVLAADNLRWTDTPAAQILQKRTGVKTYLDNDVNAAVWGENKLGAGKNSKHLLGVWLGTGIGGGLIFNGELYYGPFFTAGEIGHMIALPFNPPGERSLEHNCSRTAVVNRLIKLIKGNRKSKLVDLAEGDLDKIKSKLVAKAYEDKDELTVEVLDSAAELLGITLAGVTTLLSLDRIVLGGGLTEAMGNSWVNLIEQHTRRLAFPERCKQVKVVASTLEDRAGLMGAAMIAMQRHEK
ncbi:MAG: ROK family protein [Phycisphaeraceae bacterium]|nr:ROK family protein [Phycisphaeraceae bacterium]